MTDIDDRLKSLDLEFLHGVPVHLTDEMIEQIKQAFADAGYIPPHAADRAMALGGYMKGQEFYDRFHQLLLEDDSSLWVDRHINELAKRAAGLE